MKKIIPFGNRLLVKRKQIEKLGDGTLELPDTIKERLTELAEVVYVPDRTFADEALLKNAEEIMMGLATKAKHGDAGAVEALMKFNDYLHIKAIKVGDTVFLGTYIGTDFRVSESGETLTLCDGFDIRGMVIES
jgi:co-chaperonin GroES (HSP10)